jgi:hypothetical protein
MGKKIIKVSDNEVELVPVSGEQVSKEKWEKLLKKLDKFFSDNKITLIKKRRDDKGDDRYIDFVFRKNDAQKVKMFLKKIV